MNKWTRTATLGLALAMTAIEGARGDLLTFTDPGDFDAAKGSVALVTEDFSSATPGALPEGTPVDFGGFTGQSVDSPNTDMFFYIAPDPFTDAQHAPFTASQHLGWAEDPAGIGNGNGTFGPTITVTFDVPQTAVSFLFLDSDGTDEYRLLVDGNSIDAFPSSADTSFDGSYFFGIVDTMATFTTLVFTQSGTDPGGAVEEFGIDDLSYTTVVIPEPASGLLAGLGLAGLGAVGLARRRRRASSAA